MMKGTKRNCTVGGAVFFKFALTQHTFSTPLNVPNCAFELNRKKFSRVRNCQKMTMIPHIKKILIHGFRGFASQQTLNFAVPNNNTGSGLTILVGPNNSGKSSIIESLTAVTQPEGQLPTFGEGKRNISADSRVKIQVTNGDENTYTLSTVTSGGSETTLSGTLTNPSGAEIFVLPSRRTFDPYFGKSDVARASYVIHQQKLQSTRAGQTAFSGRIFHINNDLDKRKKFETVLSKVLDPLPNWTIDQSEQGQYYLKYSNGTHTQSSDGLGEGLLSIFFIVDALYDSQPGSMIVIDEPELSLHPQLQAKVRDLLLEYSTDRQIVISTHSPKFIDWHAIAAGAQIARITNRDGEVETHELSSESRSNIAGFLNDMNNPHVLGLDANEVFFLADKVVLLEGQEDVMFLPRVLEYLDVSVAGEFYGWGVGGAEKMSTIAQILKDLGFKKVAGILDHDKASKIPDLENKFSTYLFVAQPADDIRTKTNKPNKTSLLSDGNDSVREEYKAPMRVIVSEINSYLA